MNVLVTGGCGFIGSHTCVELIENGYSVVIVDNLCNSHENVIDKISQITENKVEFFNCDLMDYDSLESIFKVHKFHYVIHFAGLKAVGESVKYPIDYYNTNINTTLNLINMMHKYSCKNLIFSSSATVYGTESSPLKETTQCGVNLTNPYGKTKYFIECILQDFQKANDDFKITILRYFNPVGAHPSGLIGENPKNTPNNLMPYLINVALFKDSSDTYDKLKVFGNNYLTVDGTGVRDYIHVVDLANAHVNACKYMRTGVSIYNIGTGNGVSVLQLISCFEKSNNIRIPYEIVNPRPGDVDTMFCDCSLAGKELYWSAKFTLEEICKHSWIFAKRSL